MEQEGEQSEARREGNDNHGDDRDRSRRDDGHQQPSSGGSGRPGKIFVGGLSWDTTDDGFRHYFSQFGEIQDAIVMRDRHTGTSRGFGFVTFVDYSSVDKVMKERCELDGRSFDCKLCPSRGT